MAKSKPKKEPWDVEKVDVKPILETLSNPTRDIISIDQAFDGIGVSILLRNVELSQALEIVDIISSHLDDRYQENNYEIKESLAGVFGTEKRKHLSVAPVGRNRKPFSVGFVGSTLNGGDKFQSRRSLLLHAKITHESGIDPEWKQARKSAKRLAKTVRDVLSIKNDPECANTTISLESLALHGSSSSIAILPCLGIVWGSIWEELDAVGIKGAVELPIGTWKKAFSGYGHAKKKDVQTILYRAGFERFSSDDESDAVAMSIVLASGEHQGKSSTGRIRPKKV